ncbi:MAG: hypothetical protein IIA68_06575 [Proteobacteria bacterium]|nr:hypothetical protein [Pseudomonadota bacterium]
MGPTVVDRLQSEFSGLISVLDEAGEISLKSTADDNLRKALLLATTSYFEHRMTDAVLSFVSHITNGHVLITSFVRNKAISRQYHTWFNWDKKNANSFFGLFGIDFREFMKEKIKNDDELEVSIQAFLELGNDRNRLVHQNFGSFSLEKTSDEIYAQYQKAMKFIDAFPGALREFTIATAVEEIEPTKKP